MNVGDVVRIKDVSTNKKEHRGLICLILEVENILGDGLVCIIQTGTKRLRYHEVRLEKINVH